MDEEVLQDQKCQRRFWTAASPVEASSMARQFGFPIGHVTWALTALTVPVDHGAPMAWP
jgi:hypothetical protein